MDTPTIFLLIFAVSFVMTLLSFFLGIAHLSIGGHGVGGGHGVSHLHVPTGHGLHAGPVHVATPHIPHGGPASAHGVHVGQAAHTAASHGVDMEGISPFNMATALAFFTWFGGAGYLFTAYMGLLTLLAIVLAAGVGLVGASLVFTFMVRILLPGQTPYLSADDFDMPGTIGRLSVSIRAGGTGELVYSQGGTRRVTSARSEDGSALERDAEVVVVRHEGGIAYVEPIATFMESTAPEGARR